MRELLIAGAGIGGLATAVAVAAQDWQVRMYERATVLEELGAGLQLAPNATRVLLSWGLERDLMLTACQPDLIVARSAISGVELSRLSLQRMAQKYGAPYITIHRADLQRLLLQAARASGRVQICLGNVVRNVREQAETVCVQTETHISVEGEALVGADGLLSTVREQALADGPPRVTGELAYRALVRTADLPQSMRQNQVILWLGRGLHVVQYPVQRGATINLVVVVHGQSGAPVQKGAQARLDELSAEVCTPLRELLQAVPGGAVNDPAWRAWVIADRAPLREAGQMAQGRVALVGDAAHPMRPYAAQGAGMAIEDAAALAHALTLDMIDVPTRLQRYALGRWQRCARVQARAERNANIFQLSGLGRWGRDAALRALGPRLMDTPWLYGWRT